MGKATANQTITATQSFENDVYKEIWELAKPYLVKCRWWDLCHTEMSLVFLSEILRNENHEDLKDVLVPAIILHDTGWSTVGVEKNSDWGRVDMRKKHMTAGASIAKKILKKVGYDPDLTKIIIHLVATHDNAYLGIKQETKEEKLIRDADACFILTDLSFWKDYHVKSVVKDVKMTPCEFLDKQVERNSKRYTKTAKNITEKQIMERKAETTDTSITPLQRYKELKAKAETINKKVKN